MTGLVLSRVSANRPFLVAVTLVSLFCGCQAFPMGGWFTRSQSPSSEVETSTDASPPETVGDYTTISGLNLITLEGVGLVTGLDGTGGDPPPSPQRMALLKDMQRRGVRNPKQLLKSPSTAMVVVRAYLPPLIRKGEQFDVEVRLPPGSESSSLNGGWLMESDLSERAVIPGQGILAGHVFARAKGPILISHGEGDQGDLAGVLRRGRILAGGKSRRDRHLTVSLRNRYRSVRMARRITDRIGQRFYAYDRHGVREPLASAKTDRTIVLKLQPKYRNNFPRYLQVIRQIPMRENDVQRQVRMQNLVRDLESPETAEIAALTFESIGPNAIPFLKAALDHKNLEVRFHAAVALAYLDDSSGAVVLSEAARQERAFRVFALAALSTLDDGPSQLLLRDLLKPIHVCGSDTCQHRGQLVNQICPHCKTAGSLKQSAELQYGAFRALSTRDRFDPAIRGKSLKGLFALHEVDAPGDPLIHLTRLQRAEIVLFGKDQNLRTPLAVEAGNHIWLNAQPGSDAITISRYRVGNPPRRTTTSTRVADVIHTLVEFGASYPDIVQMLVQAQRQHNIAGQIAIDAMPRTGRAFFRTDPRNGTTTKTRAGESRTSPNLFPTVLNPDNSPKTTLPEAGDDKQAKAPAGPSPGTASLADRRKSDESDPAPAPPRSPLTFFSSLFR